MQHYKQKKTLKIKELASLYEKHSVVQSVIKNIINSGEDTISTQIKGLTDSLVPLVVNAVFAGIKNNIFIIMPNKEDAAYLFNDLEKLQNNNTFFFPSSYKHDFSLHVKIAKSESNIILRNRAIDAIAGNKNSIIVSYSDALIEKEANANEHKSASFAIHVNEKLSTEFLQEFLLEYGFERKDFVFGPGEFSIRGSIIDVFSFSDENPYRIDLFGDEVDSIRSFDIVSQLSLDKLDEIIIYPDLNKIVSIKNKSIIFDLIDRKTIMWCNDSKFIIDKIQKTIENIIESINYDDENCKLTRQDFIFKEDFKQAFKKYSLINKSNDIDFKSNFQYTLSTTQQIEFNKNFNLLSANIHKNESVGYKNYILSDNPRQLERLESILSSDEVKIKADFIAVSGVLHKGFIDNDIRISCYTDHQIFNRYHRTKLINDKLDEKKSAMSLREISGLQLGDFVVHIDYGIGKFGGINTIENNGKKQETIRLIYKNNDIVFVSIHALHKISKYRAADGIQPKIHKLGSGAWQKQKAKTKSKVKDIAKELIALYAKRKEEEGFRYSPDTYLQEALEASFIYEDTPDQEKATRETKADMESELPMDRLICGDVGFGKTEIAIRAAFKAVTDGKQVAVLVPTTILALQHYQTFKKRLKDLPCNVDFISRLKSRKQQNKIVQNLAQGNIDILIGTHRIVGKDVVFKDLGLLIIDEEQKFGVAIKEKLKHLRVNVDTLTLTATPIPRTMQFSLMGARDLSVISTPPPDRYPIITELHGFNEEVIRNAINKELERNGQVFFIHNRVQNIVDIQIMIERICPSTKTIVAHGQMKGSQLENVMLDFINHEFDVLIATTIIESGLDIPNANTIIINNAQNFGLSDLHQLRGRVGRSNRKAYCYLLAPPMSVLPTDARKRLQAIEEFSELGSGFNIALQDLDIRGAGNLLGGEQSGFIADIGFETYQQILNEAMFELHEETANEDFVNQRKPVNINSNKFLSPDCQIDTDMELLFPVSYVENTAERIRLYRELDNIKDEKSLNTFEQNLEDRFGKMPKQTVELLVAVQLRWLAMQLGFSKILLKLNNMFCYFMADDSSMYFNSSTFSNILKFVNSHPRICSVKEQNNKLSLQIKSVKSIKKAYDLLFEMLSW